MYIALDMGTTNTRLRLCKNGNVFATLTATIGAGSVKKLGKNHLFAELKKLIGNLISENNIKAENVEYILASGMAGSEFGLCNVPHVSIADGINGIVSHMQEVIIPEIASIPFLFVPGVKKVNGETTEDIMRGEEVESIGVFKALSLDEDFVVVLPGTHNKVIVMQPDGNIADFYTTFSGELLNNIIVDSILSSVVTHEFNLSREGVLSGACYAKEHGLNVALFHIRVMAMNGYDKEYLSSFLYGCVIGQDIQQIQKFAAGKKIFIGGRKKLKETYHILLGDDAVALDDDISENAVNRGISYMYKLYKAVKKRNDVLKSIEKEKLIVIVRNPDTETVITAMKAIYKGGVRLAEITFDRSGKTPKLYTANLIRLLKKELNMFVGAGTVTSEQEVEIAFEAGADFILSPNCDPKIIRKTCQMGMVSIPAAFTPTEIVTAIETGADYVKVFPAAQLPNGYIKAIKAPLCDAKLIAVGGVNERNAGEFIENGFSGVGIGGNLYDKNLVLKKQWYKLEMIAKECVDAVQK